MVTCAILLLNDQPPNRSLVHAESCALLAGGSAVVVTIKGSRSSQSARRVRKL